MNDNRTDRYPGLRSFKESEDMLFFGRKKEINECCNLILAHQVFVLFSKSGIGKSSLLNAGVFPMLRKFNYYPIKVRFQYTKEQEDNNSPLNVLKEVLIKDENITWNDVLFDREKPMLWELFRSARTRDNQIPVLIFDQFEEFFFYPSEQREEFLLQLAEIVHSQPPNRILQQLGAVSIDERTDEQMEWATQPLFKIVIGIRSDKVYELENIRSYIPLIFRNRYQLKPLNIEQAKEAIIEPARTDAKHTLKFQSAKFSFDPDVLAGMLAKLAERKTTGISNIDNNTGDDVLEIESSQLQIVCNYIEELVKNIVREKKLVSRPSKWDSVLDKIVIDNELFDPQKDIAHILDGFYRKQISTLKLREQIKARTVLEEHLISDGNRTSLTQSQMSKHLDQRTISRLLGLRLIKEEYTHLGLTYELSHDTLVEPVVRAYTTRKTNSSLKKTLEKNLEFQRELQEAETKNRIMEKAKRDAEEAWKKVVRGRKLMLTLMFVAFMLFVLTVLLMIRSFQMKIDLNDQLVERVTDIGDKYYKDNNHAMAFNVWDALLSRGAGFKGVDSVAGIIRSNFFFDISGGIQFKNFDNNRYAVIQSDHSLNLWSIGDAQQPAIHRDTVIQGCFGIEASAVGPYIAYWNAKGEMWLSDIRSCRSNRIQEARIKVNEEDKNIAGFSASVFSLDDLPDENTDARFLPNSGIFTYADTLGNLRFFDCTRWVELPFGVSKEKRKRNNKSVDIVSLAKDSYVAIKVPDSSFAIWDIRNPSGNRLAIKRDQTIDVVNVPGVDVVITIKEGTYKKRLYIYPSATLMNPVAFSCDNKPDIAYSEDGGRLFFYDDNNALRVYNLKSGKEDTLIRNVWAENAGAAEMRYLRPSRDGSVFIYNDNRNHLVLCDIAKGRSMKLPEIDYFPKYTLSPDGMYLETLEKTGYLEIQKVFSGERVLSDTIYTEMRGRLELLQAQAMFSRNGDLVAYRRKAGDENYFVVYNLRSGKKILDDRNMKGQLIKLKDGYCEWRTDDNQAGVVFLNDKPRNEAYYRNLYPRLPEKELRKYRPQKGILNFW